MSAIAPPSDLVWLDAETGDVMVSVLCGDVLRPVTPIEIATIDPHHFADLESAAHRMGADSGVAEHQALFDADAAIDSFIQRHEHAFQADR